MLADQAMDDPAVERDVFNTSFAGFDECNFHTYGWQAIAAAQTMSRAPEGMPSERLQNSRIDSIDNMV
jgi:hypothetical protein